MNKQTTSDILMVRPVSFGFNPIAAESNHFQHKIDGISDLEVQELAKQEFNALSSALSEAGVTVNIVEDSPEPKKPDAIFPNNWGSYHEDGTVVLYPMQSENRRWERRRNILEMLGKGYELTTEIDLSHYEAENMFLEGTGSLIFDRPNKLAYACLSSRTHPEVLNDFCSKLGYTAVLFHSVDAENRPIYHTNVMMAMAKNYTVICLESIKSEEEKAMLLQKFEETGKQVVDISLEQVSDFAGNVIELENKDGQSLLVMSSRAYAAFTDEQKATIEKYSKIVHAPIPTIEKIGGGGARCMIAEVFLPKK